MLRIKPATGSDPTALQSRHSALSMGISKSPLPLETPQFLGECWDVTAHCCPCHHPPLRRDLQSEPRSFWGSVSSHGNHLACLKQPVAFSRRDMRTLAKEVGLASLRFLPWKGIPWDDDQEAGPLVAWCSESILSLARSTPFSIQILPHTLPPSPGEPQHCISTLHSTDQMIWSL